MSNLYDVRIKFNSTIIIAGPSMCGKTSLVIKLIKYRPFTENPVHIIWCYSEIIPPKMDVKVQFIKGIPDIDSIPKNSLIILDDLLQESIQNDTLSKLFSRISHHRNCCVIYLTQNLYQQGRFSRTVNLNTHYLFLFKNVRDQTIIHTLARQMFPSNANFLVEAYKHAISKPYGYLMIDLRPESNDDLRIRSNIFDENYVYINKNV